jgi:hypothetical protein
LKLSECMEGIHGKTSRTVEDDWLRNALAGQWGKKRAWLGGGELGRRHRPHAD